MENKALGKGLAALIPQKKEISSLDNSGGEGVLYLKTSIIKDKNKRGKGV